MAPSWFSCCNRKSTSSERQKALAHGVVAETSVRIAGNPAGSGFYVGLSNEELIGKINIDTFLKVNKKEASIGSKGRANVVELDLKKSFDFDRFKVNLAGRIGYGAGVEQQVLILKVMVSILYY